MLYSSVMMITYLKLYKLVSHVTFYIGVSVESVVQLCDYDIILKTVSLSPACNVACMGSVLSPLYSSVVITPYLKLYHLVLHITYHVGVGIES